MRHKNAALLEGDYVAVNDTDPNVYSYLRRYKDKAVLVSINLSPEPQKVSFDLSAQGFGAKQAKTLLTSNQAGATQSLAGVSLAPYTVYVGEVSK